MSSVRHLVLTHRRLFALLLLAVMAMRILLPAGVMPSIQQGQITIIVCTGEGPQMMQMPIAIDEDAGHQGDAHKAKAGAPCAFAGLSSPALSGADPVLLAAMLLLVFVAAIRAPDQRPARFTDRLRPPLRGPPALA